MGRTPAKKVKVERGSPAVSRHQLLSPFHILEQSLAFVADATTLAQVARSSRGMHRSSSSVAEQQVEELARKEPLCHEEELNSILFERAEVETWLGLLHSLTEEQYEVEFTAYILEADLAGFVSVTDSLIQSRALQDLAGISRIPQLFGFEEVERLDSLHDHTSRRVCPYDGRPSRLLTFASSQSTCLSALEFASSLRTALRKRVDAGGLTWATVDRWGAWKLKSLIRAENYYDFDPIVPYRYILDVPPYGCIAQKFLLAEPQPTSDAGGVPTRPSIVLDLDETLIHTEVAYIEDADFTFTLDGGCASFPQTLHVRVRPHAHAFLRTVATLFEVIVFTASERPYAEAVLRHLDPSGDLVEHLLCREDCTFIDGEFIKDLGGLSRDLARTVLVDNRPEMYCYHPECGIPISSWFSDRRDCELLRLLPGLRFLASPACTDVRTYVRHRWRTHEEVARVARLLGRATPPLPELGAPSPRMTDVASPNSATSRGSSPPSCCHDTDDLVSEDGDGSSMFYDSGDGVELQNASAGEEDESSPDFATDEEEGDENDDDGFLAGSSTVARRPRLMRVRTKPPPITEAAPDGEIAL